MPTPRRVAMLSVHTSPLEQPGIGDAGGLNVYVVEVARTLARRGVEVEVFTRRRTAAVPETVELAPGVLVRHVVAGPFEGLGKEDLPGQLCAFGVGVMRSLAQHPEGHYDVVHSHYWLSGQVGWLVAERWGVPLVHTMHTMARVKNAALAAGDAPEPSVREFGEEQVVSVADRLVANTDLEARDLVELYGADPAAVRVVPPGVDLDVFTPGDRAAARRDLGVGPEDLVLLFVGRIQPLKGPDLLVEAAARMLAARPELRGRLRVVLLGGRSGVGGDTPAALRRLVADLGVDDVTAFLDPTSRPDLARWYRAADVVTVPSHNESFGLVAVEAQACGTPVLASAVGGLRTAVGTDTLLSTRDPDAWARALLDLLDDPERRRRLGAEGVAHAAGYGWDATVEALLDVYGEAMDHRRRAPRRADTGPDPEGGTR